ncbi:hypothetical protein EJB05_37644 [Eragrostis curvula]|uniref:Aldose 1-epimerase n=1 Tax=Eragrostis curvula TaxID=38414 RepID=A0A5J9TS63_9POAL|nr:hypothetical protein EJB05_37644 [Eragrostis curvula]
MRRCSVVAIFNWPPMARCQLVLLLLLCIAGAVLASGADGRKPIGVYELKKGNFSVKVTNLGAILMSVVLPDSKGNLADVVLGKTPSPNTLTILLTSDQWPAASRNGYPGAGSSSTAKSTTCTETTAGNTLHSGGRQFVKSIWEVKEYVCGGDSPYITLYHYSFDGEQGFPGAVDVYVTYRLSSPYTLGVHMNATALDKATPVNLLSHTYWNLGGHGSGDVLGHTLKLFASRHLVLDKELLPSSGRVEPVAGTPLDFRTPTPIGARIRQASGGQVVGYDANFIVDGEGMRPVAVARDGASGRALELWANQATVQVYTANWLNNTKGKDGKVYNQYAGFTLETMGYVDAVNHPEFPSQTLRPGQKYKHDMVLKFSF